MFFHKVLSRTVYVHPRHCGSQLKQSLLRQLHEEVEGKVHEQFGYVVTIIGIESTGEGIIQQGSGLIAFTVHYSAVCYCPFKNEIADAIVVYIHESGFYAEIGPVRVFVSNHNIPSEYRYDPLTSSLITADESIKIKQDDAVRIELIGFQIKSEGVSVVGNMRGNYLGKI